MAVQHHPADVARIRYGNSETRLRWWEGGRFIGILSLSLWLCIWKVATALF